MFKQQAPKAVIYCRVSTKEQAEEGNSLVTQEKVCREYALKNGYDVAAIFIEQGESAKTADRTELKKLMTFCSVKKNEVSVVISYKIDRISRNTDDYSQIRILLRRYGVEIKSTSEYFEDTPAGRFMENIIANVAQFDNDVRAERSIGGMRDAMREGRYVWQAPFGYSNVRIDGKATIEPNTLAPIIRKAFDLIALNQHSVEEIRKDMRIHGLVGPSGRPISKSYFYKLIKNELYAGWINKFGERHSGKFEHIISDELFSKVQSVLSGKRKKSSPRISDNPDFPLRRFLRHSSGKSLTGCWSTGNKKKYPYYMIRNTGINIRKERLEDTFKGWLNHFKIDIVHFEKIYSYLRLYLENKFLKTKSEKDNLEKRTSELKSKQSIIINKNIDGIINDELCKEKLAEVAAELYDISQTRSLFETEINKEDLLGIVRKALLQPGDLWEKADLAGKIKLQWFYFPNGIEIDKNGSRTHKVCSLFKLKGIILPSLSSNVNHRNQKSNTDNWQILTVCDATVFSRDQQTEENMSFMLEMVKEISCLGEIIKKSSET